VTVLFFPGNESIDSTSDLIQLLLPVWLGLLLFKKICYDFRQIASDSDPGSMIASGVSEAAP
jgi:hypothetical protein